MSVGDVVQHVRVVEFGHKRERTGVLLLGNAILGNGAPAGVPEMSKIETERTHLHCSLQSLITKTMTDDDSVLMIQLLKMHIL